MTLCPPRRDVYARACPLCGDQDEAWLNVTRIWTRGAYPDHCRDRHPGMDWRTLWALPLASEKGTA